MNLRYIPVFALLLTFAGRCSAQDSGRVAPASLPLPLSASSPVAPDILRSHNPWTLPMTGAWKFALTRGHTMAGGQFVPSAAGSNGIMASSNEEKNPPENAFDGSTETRWCADGDSYPQSLQADLGKPTRVAAVHLAWERATERYRCRIEFSDDGKRWKTISDARTEAGIGDGPIPVTPTTARYVRVTVLGTDGSGWASIREFGIDIDQGGKQVAWRPAPRQTAPVVESGRADFAAVAFDDSAWNTLAVPSNWEMAGYSIPTYNAVDNTVGQYRRVVTIPTSWAGKRIYWHFDGALDGAEVYVNGVRAGYHESGYTAWDIDLTGLLKPGEKNLFAVRVSKSTPSSDCETGDFQAMGGIYRDTFLVAVPQTHAADITVRTPLAANYRDATLDAQVQIKGAPGQSVEVTGQLFTADGHATGIKLSGTSQIAGDGAATVALSAPVTAPKLWSAEKPNLYYVVLEISAAGKPVERIEQRFGFRQVEVKDNIVLWNGKPIKCTGVCRHDFWADKGFALTDKEWTRDLDLIKAANVNAIRTSHYNHAARFLEMCDERGIYILDEVPYCWIGDQVKDPKFAPFLLQRAAETLARDKNRPCVLAWSIGNENPSGPDSQAVIDQVRQTDPTHPAFVSSVSPNDIKGQAWEDDHYPGPDAVDRIANNAAWGANFSEHPHIFYQKETQDYDPGASDLWSEALIKTWDKLWKDPTILGSFIWEWQNQGIADKFPDKTRDFYYGRDHLRQENNKGIVSAYRVPKPEWWIVKMVYSQVVVGTRDVTVASGACTVPLTNHYAFTDLGELTCRWTAFDGTRKLSTGSLPIACPPGQSVNASYPAPAGMTRLHLDFDHADGSPVTSANLTVVGTPAPLAPPALAAGSALTTQGDATVLTIGNSLQSISFDKRTGAVQSWRVRNRMLLSGGPTLNLGEAKNSGEKNYYKSKTPPVIESAHITAETIAGGIVRVTVTGNVLTATSGSPLGILTCTYDIQPDAQLRVAWNLDWTAADTRLWENGLKLEVPADLTKMRWQRDSYFTDYPEGHLGEPTGACASTDGLFRATRRDLHWLTLCDAGGAGLALLSADAPLAGRAYPGTAGTTLFASREVAGPQDFSGNWVSEHDISAHTGKSLSGTFALRAIAP